MKAQTIETYIAINNPKATARALEEMGAPKVKSNEDLLAKVHFATDKFGMKAFEKLAQIDTPYRKLILSTLETKSNCGGGCSGCGKSNAGGPEDQGSVPTGKPVEQPNPHGVMPPHSNHFLTAGVVLLGVIAIAVIVKN